MESSVVPDLAELALAQREATALFLGAAPEALLYEHGGVLGGVTGLDHPTANGLVVGHGDDPADLAAVLSRLAAVPYVAQLAGGRHARSRELLARTGHGLAESLPAMVVDAETVRARPAPPGLQVLRPEPGSALAAACTALAADVFGVPPPVMALSLGPAAAADSRTVTYAGTVGGEVVVLAQALALDGVGLVSNVATSGVHRRHGYGAALSLAATRGLLGAGCARVWLVSSRPGNGVYARLGYREAGRWETWLRTPGLG